MVSDTVAAGIGAVAYSRRIRRLVRTLAPDVVHSNGVKSHLIATMASGDVPVVWHIRDLIGRRRLVARALRRAAPKAAGAIAISKLVERDARTVLGNLPIHVVYDAIDTDAFSPGPGDGDWLDRLAGFAPSTGPTIRVGLIATYARWKGQDLFLDAISRIEPTPNSSDVRFFIVGGPIYETRGSQFTESELRDRADRLAVTARVGFVPFQRDVAEVYRALDVVVHASTQPEPFGRTIAEALACGRSVVLSESTGASEILPSDVPSVAFRAGDANSLAAGIRTVLDTTTPGSTSAEARAAAVEAFSRARLGGRLLELYSGLR